VPATQVQDELRTQFACWGLPAWLRVDNGYPWGNFNDLPTALALWLIGLGVAVHGNEPCHPEQNPKVERSQDTGSRWTEPWTCQTAGQLQERFLQEDRVQRELYPAVGGRSRQEAFPALAEVVRPYRRGLERRHWDLDRVLEHLAEYQAVRKVSSGGSIGIYDQTYYVGRANAGQSVYVQLDPEEVVWVITDLAGTELRQHAAKQITRKRIMALAVQRQAGVGKCGQRMSEICGGCWAAGSSRCAGPGAGHRRQGDRHRASAAAAPFPGYLRLVLSHEAGAALRDTGPAHGPAQNRCRDSAQNLCRDSAHNWLAGDS